MSAPKGYVPEGRGLRAAVLELPAMFGNVAEAGRVAQELLGAGPADLVLLPEASLTGYVSARGDFDLAPFAEPLEGSAYQLLCALSRSSGADVVGPVIEREGERSYNAIVGVSPSGRRWLHYRKRHPWYPERWAAPGELAVPLVTWRGLTVTAAICFDVHFLAAEARAQLEAADLLLFPSAWVEEEDSRPALLAQLAKEFQLGILNANWGPGTPALSGQGRSLAVDWMGRARAEARAGRLDVRLDELLVPTSS